MGAGKKGALGATKVKTNFADLENQANLADQQKVPEKKQTEEEQAETINSVRLAYQDLSLKAQKQEEKLKHIDPTKAKQMERLGMGFNVRGNVSHSVLTDMKTIAQEPTPKYSTTSTKIFEKEPKDDFFDDYSNMYSTKTTKTHDPDLAIMGFEEIEIIDSRHSNVTSMFNAGAATSTTSPNRNHKTNLDARSNNKTDKSYNTYENTDAQKKFGGAKAISSDQFFEQETSSFERSANLAKFQGSNSISSADYFGDNKSNASSRGSFTFFPFEILLTPSIRQHTKSNIFGTLLYFHRIFFHSYLSRVPVCSPPTGLSDIHYNGPDLDDVRESVRQGVTKVAGRLSSLASGVMSSLQDKYGG